MGRLSPSRKMMGVWYSPRTSPFADEHVMDEPRWPYKVACHFAGGWWVDGGWPNLVSFAVNGHYRVKVTVSLHLIKFRWGGGLRTGQPKGPFLRFDLRPYPIRLTTERNGENIALRILGIRNYIYYQLSILFFLLIINCVLLYSQVLCFVRWDCRSSICWCSSYCHLCLSQRQERLGVSVDYMDF